MNNNKKTKKKKKLSGPWWDFLDQRMHYYFRSYSRIIDEDIHDIVNDIFLITKTTVILVENWSLSRNGWILVLRRSI